LRRVVFRHHHPVAYVGRHVDLCRPIQRCHAYQETIWILVKLRLVAAVHGRADLLATPVCRLALEELCERQGG